MSAGCLPQVIAIMTLTTSALIALQPAPPDTQDFPAPAQVPPTASPSPSPTPKPTDKPEAARPKPTRKPSGQGNITGLASWFATGPNGPYAAACRPLRRALGADWRGQTVLVAYKRKAVEVRLTDFCASTTKLIDLSDETFSYLGRLSQGVLPVTVSR